MQALTSVLKLMPLLLISHIYCASITHIPHKKNLASNSPKKITTVIFDAGGVLFQESRSAFIKKVGLGKLTKYAVFNWSNPETTVLNTLHAISSQESKQPTIPLLLREKKMPCCIINWQLGHKSHLQTHNKLKKQIDRLAQKNHFKNSQEKELVLRMLEIGIDPQHLNDIVKPVTGMIELVKDLKARKYKLIILANLAQEQYDLLHKIYPEITQLFDDIIFSAHVNILKPNQEIYQHLLDTHKLIAQECVLVDSLKEHTAAAEQKGMHSIWHKNIRATRTSLAKLGV